MPNSDPKKHLLTSLLLISLIHASMQCLHFKRVKCKHEVQGSDPSAIGTEPKHTWASLEGTSKTALLPSAVRLMRFTSSTVASEGMYFLRKVNTSPGRWISVGEVNMRVVKSS